MSAKTVVKLAEPLKSPGVSVAETSSETTLGSEESSTTGSSTWPSSSAVFTSPSLSASSDFAGTESSALRPAFS